MTRFKRSASILGVVFVGALLWLALRAGPITSVIDLLSNFTAIFLGIFIEASSFLLLGTLASGLVEVFVNQNDIARFIPRDPLRGAMAGAVMGILFPVCECGVVPLTRRLIKKGLPISVGIAFLLAAPVFNPIVIASTWMAFGFGRMFSCALV